MTREEKAIKALKWFKAYNEEDYCGGDRIQDEHGDWYYRITEQDFEAFDTAIKALEQEPTTKNDLGVDCISRADAIGCLAGQIELSPSNVASVHEYLKCVNKRLHDLPSVTPQEPKTGHWIVDNHKIRAFGKKNETHDYSVHCDKCNYAWDYTTDKEGSLVSNFCPNCGADMREVEE